MPVAVVTGSSSGIGRATAIEFARRGYHVVIHTRQNLPGLMETERLISQLTGRQDPIPERSQELLCLSGDISDARTCHDIVAASFQWKGGVDAWVNNAGADVLTGRLATASFEDRLKRLLEVDVIGTIRLSRLVSAYMRCQDVDAATFPTIINLGWDQASTGMEDTPGQLFCTTKSAVDSFTRALALSVAPRIRVHLVAPGWIKTKWGDNEASTYWDERAKSESLMQRWGTPQDVARAIAVLCSPDMEFVNSQVLCVNGGLRTNPIRS